MKNKIILYYKYVSIIDVQKVYQWHKDLCAHLLLKGRIIIAHEGINGTLGGTAENIDIYVFHMRNHVLFKDVDFKESEGSAADFPRLSIKIRPEIVAFSRKLKTPLTETPGEYLTPEEVHNLLKKKEENLLVFDVRNTYESRIGYFEGAIKADIQNFCELPEYIDTHQEMFKDKEVLMYCTGDVRCEMASAYLKSLKVADKVYHLQGGIHRYAENYPDGFFRGKNYVFDGRISLKVTDDILAVCDFCSAACDQYFNCLNTQCNKQIIVCWVCQRQKRFMCNEECTQLVQSGAVKARAYPIIQENL